MIETHSPFCFDGSFHCYFFFYHCVLSVYDSFKRAAVRHTTLRAVIVEGIKDVL